jgi:hypothetical protein
MDKPQKKEKTTELPDAPQPGAGVDPKKVINPNKRLKKAYRDNGLGLPSLKAYAQAAMEDAKGLSLAKYAETWLLNKAEKHTAARKERKARVRAARAARRREAAPTPKKKK